MAALRINIPTVFVSGGPMESGKVNIKGKIRSVDLIDAMVAAADSSVSDAEVDVIERSACPTCGSCSGMFTANSMNCLTEALGLALPGNGSVLGDACDRKGLFVEAGHLVVDLARRYYEQDDDTALPRNIASFKAFENAMTLDIAMGGSTNTVLHLLAAAYEGGIPFTMQDIDRLSRRCRCCARWRRRCRTCIWKTCNRAGGVMAISASSTAPTCSTAACRWCTASRWKTRWAAGTSFAAKARASANSSWPRRATCRRRSRSARSAGSKNSIPTARPAASRRCARFFQGRRPCGTVRQSRVDGCIVKTAGVDESILKIRGSGAHLRKPGCFGRSHSGRKITAGDVVVVRYEGPRGGPGMQEMLYPTSYLKSKGLGKVCALITDGRFSGGSSGLSIGHISPEAARAA